MHWNINCLFPNCDMSSSGELENVICNMMLAWGEHNLLTSFFSCWACLVIFDGLKKWFISCWVPFGSRNVTEMVMIMIYIRIRTVTSLNKSVSISSVVSIIVRLKQIRFNVIDNLLRYQYVNQMTNDTLVSRKNSIAFTPLLLLTVFHSWARRKCQFSIWLVVQWLLDSGSLCSREGVNP